MMTVRDTLGSVHGSTSIFSNHDRAWPSRLSPKSDLNLFQS